MNLRQLKKLVNETVRAEQIRKGRKPSGRNFDALIERTVRHVLSEGDDDATGQESGGDSDSGGFRVIDQDPAVMMQKLATLGPELQDLLEVPAGEGDPIGFKTGIKLAPGDCEPTQDCIVAKKSLIDQCQNNWNGLENVLTGGLLGADGGSPIVIFQAGGTNYVLDGHHRWSQFCCTAPTKKEMQCSALVAEGLDDPEAALAVCHALIIALAGESVTKGGKDDNLLEMDQAKLYERAISFCQENFTEKGQGAKKSAIEVIKAHAADALKPGTEWHKEEGEMETWANYLAYNGANMLKGPAGTNDGAGFPRNVMPQLADAGIDVSSKDGGHGFTGGTVNIKDPLEESININRWNKLAGILKD